MSQCKSTFRSTHSVGHELQRLPLAGRSAGDFAEQFEDVLLDYIQREFLRASFEFLTHTKFDCRISNVELFSAHSPFALRHSPFAALAQPIEASFAKPDLNAPTSVSISASVIGVENTHAPVLMMLQPSL